MTVRRFVGSGFLVAALLSSATILAAQQQRRQQATPPTAASAAPQAAPEAPLSAPEVRKLFEAYTVSEAQDALGLSEAQYGRFVTRFRAMQAMRRVHQQRRNQILAELRKLTADQGSVDENRLAERLKALRDEDERAAAEIKKGYEGVDETLDIRQQARFRLFEERMEQRQLELLMRARQNARAAAGRRGRGSD